MALPLLAFTLAACHVTSSATPLNHKAFAERVTAAEDPLTLLDQTRNQSTRAALLGLVDALDRAYAAYDLAAPAPKIRVVPPNHPMMRQFRMAVAAVTESGQEMIYFNRAFLEGNKSLDLLVMHEVAHLKTWREHGHDILPHGREYRSICRTASPRPNCTRKQR